MNNINKTWILFELQDAHDELTRILSDLKNNIEYGETEYRIYMAHLYHHLNSAWNTREATIEEIENQEKFDEWRQFPKDIEPL